jgi:hypothetical protein
MYLHIFVKKTEPEKSKQMVTIESMDVTTDDCDNITEKKGKIVLPVKISYNSKSEIINFVNVHLPSKPGKIDERNKCLKKSTDNLRNNSIFVFGDMNYRTSTTHEVTNEEKPKIESSSKICCINDNEQKKIMEKLFLDDEQKKNMELLNNEQKKIYMEGLLKKKHLEYMNEQLLKDQLSIQIKNKVIDFKEEVISFCPTCRFKENPTDKINDVNSRCNYDTKRYPSWCDRILYYLNTNKFNIIIKQNSYNSKHITLSSDHALVLLGFSISLGQTGGYYDKYLKYKQKYINLQNQIFTQHKI